MEGTMPTDVSLIVSGITAVFIFFAAILLVADMTWKPRK
jgi:hypothetical protein